jgi:hypothetical protein
MSPTYILIGAVLIVVVMGAILAPIFARRKRSDRFHDKFGPEYDRTVENAGTEKKAQKELIARRKHVETLNIRPLTVNERERYQVDWAAVQGKFVDQPAKATQEADHLIMEVMALRAYPVSDFDQRAADISVNYPTLVTNYRAAREIALKNTKQKADTEELRHALIYYRSLFDELLRAETVVPENS